MVKDHLGNEYNTVKEMCKVWNISSDTYSKRVNEYGWTVQQALETAVKINGVRDHLGVEYKSIRDMCSAWNISPTTYRKRIAEGYSLKDTLENNIEYDNSYRFKPRLIGDGCTDHLNNFYTSKAEMCRHYNIPYNNFDQRIKSGMSLKNALTLPSIRGIVYDHLGHRFKTKLEMCDYWGVKYSDFYNRLKQGMSVKDALTSKNQEIIYYDHMKNEFKTVKEMCKYWKILYPTYSVRVRKGWSIEKALTYRSSCSVCNRKCSDHLNNQFDSFKKMCEYWGRQARNVSSRLDKGWSLKDALETEDKKITLSIDCFGNKFFTQIDMCKHYNIESSKFHARINKLNWTLQQALLISDIEYSTLGNISTKIKECTMTNQELFDLTHSVSIDEKGKKVWTCKLCGKVVKKINEANLEETIARTNPELYWCNNSTEEDGTCIGRLSSIAYDENPDMCVPKMLYNHKKRKSGATVYKFECKKCGLVAPMTFEQVVEHKMEHINNKE